MVPMRLMTGLCLSICLGLAAPAQAHHSFAIYEATKTLTLEGTARTVQWGNPHVRVRMLVPAAAHDTPQEWELVTSNPGILKRFGWTQHSIAPGDHIRVLCFPKRDGAPECQLITLFELATGQTLQTKLRAPAH